MPKRRITLSGPGAKGVVVNATLLRNLLTLVIDGSQRALRMRTEGRSTARGTPPRWISAAAEMDVRILPGSTVLELDAPTLLESDPEQFQQNSLFPEVDPEWTGVDYLAESLAAATGDIAGGSDRFDKSLLEMYRQFEHVFDHGISTLSIEGRTAGGAPILIELDRPKVSTIREVERRIPPAQQVVIAGLLDTIRHSDRTFTLVSPIDREAIKGIADSEQDLQALWGKNVVVAGAAHFSAESKVLRIEAASIREASEKDLQLWAVIPEPVGAVASAKAVRVPQGPRTGLKAIIGQWPGDEDEQVIADALEQMS